MFRIDAVCYFLDHVISVSGYLGISELIWSNLVLLLSADMGPPGPAVTTPHPLPRLQRGNVSFTSLF